MAYSQKSLRSMVTRTIPLAGFIFVGLMNAPDSQGQPQAGSRSKFAVTVVKPTNLNLRQQIDMRALPDGGVTATSVTLQFLIKVAYGVQDSQISGGPRLACLRKIRPPGKAGGRH